MTRNLTTNAIKKYKLIIDEWFNNNFNGKQAYLKFYPNVKDQTASTNFAKIQVLPEVEAYINVKRQEAAKIVKTTHEGILQELVNWVSSDITETISLTPEEIKELPVEVKRLINKYKTTSRDIYDSKGNVIERINTIELQFVSKERAIEMINKHVGFYEIDNRQKANTINIVTSNDKHKAIVEKIMKGD